MWVNIVSKLFVLRGLFIFIGVEKLFNKIGVNFFVVVFIEKLSEGVFRMISLLLMRFCLLIYWLLFLLIIFMVIGI